MNDTKGKAAGAGFCELLGIVFIVLKLTKTITWPWVWVLSPIWLPVVVYLAVVAILALWVNWKKRKKDE